MLSTRLWQSILAFLWLLLLNISQAFGEQNERYTNEEEYPYQKSGLITAVEATLKAAGRIWNDDVIQSAISLRRNVRDVGRHARDISTIFSPFISSVSAVVQVFSYLPSVIQVIVAGVSGLVNVAGRGIGLFATGVDASASAINVVGQSVQTLSSSVPSLVTALVVGGSFLFLLFPGIQDAAFSALARFVLILAGRVAAGARSFVDKKSLFSTILQTVEVFTKKTHQEFT